MSATSMILKKRNGHTMRGSPSARIRLSAYQSRACHIRQSCYLAVTQSHVDVLPLACPRSPQKCCHYGIGGVQSCSQVCHSNSHFHWWTISRSRNVHQSHFRLNHDIVAGPFPVWTRLPVTSDASVDNSCIDLVNTLEVHFVFLESVREVILH